VRQVLMMLLPFLGLLLCFAVGKIAKEDRRAVAKHDQALALLFQRGGRTREQRGTDGCVEPDADISDLCGQRGATMSVFEHHRQRVSARLDPEVLEVVEREAARERRPVSSLLRNIVSDWAEAARREPEQGAAA
jgi:hypothetical protein